MTKIQSTIVAGDEFGKWLLDHILEQHSSLHAFISANYKSRQEVKNKYQYLYIGITSPNKTISSNLFDEVCGKLKIPQPKRAIGINLLNEKKARLKASRGKRSPKNTEIPAALFKILTNHNRIITLENIQEILGILNRLGENYLNEVIIEQIVAKYFESHQME